MNKQKQTFIKPEAEVIKFEKDDVIVTSNGNGTQTITGTGQEGSEFELS